MKLLRTRIYEMFEYWIRDRKPKETLRTFAEKRYPKTNIEIVNTIGWFKVCSYFESKYKNILNP